MYSFKDGFKRARKAKGLTQEKFCNVFTNYDGSKFSLSTIRNWEQGRNTPELKTIEALCKFFDCDMDYLFNNIDYRTHDNAFICRTLGLSERAVDFLLETHKQYPSYMDSVNFVLESTNFENSLYYMYRYADSIRRATMLRHFKAEQIAKLKSIEEYKPNLNLLEEISKAQDSVDLNEYMLSNQFRFIVDELSRKVREEFEPVSQGQPTTGSQQA